MVKLKQLRNNVFSVFDNLVKLVKAFQSFLTKFAIVFGEYFVIIQMNISIQTVSANRRKRMRSYPSDAIKFEVVSVFLRCKLNP